MISSGGSAPQDAGGLRACRDLQWFTRHSDPRTCHYLPVQPDLRRGVTGDTLTSIIEGGTVAYLMLSAAWTATPAALDKLREKVAGSYPEISPADVRLAFAPVERVRCEVKLGDGNGHFTTIASSATSGMPPYDAVFSLALADETLTRAKAALRGEPDHLAIEYTAELAVPVSGTATLDVAGDLVPASAAGDAGDPGELREWLDEAVNRGSARVTLAVAEPHAGELAIPLYEALMDRSVEFISGRHRESIPEHIHITVRLDEQARNTVRAFADVGVLVSRQRAPAAKGGTDAAN